MKKSKNILVMIGLAIILACAGFLSGCGNTAVTNTHEESHPPWMEKVRTCDWFEEWCDTEEGVHYILWYEWKANGYGAAITVRYNADGTPYNCKENKDKENKSEEYGTIVKEGME